eukprot:1212411-Pleurochrysis_carterae.AAC.2
MALAPPSDFAPGPDKQQTASLMPSEQRVNSYMQNDKAKDLGVPEGMPPQIARISASVWPQAKRRSATLAAPPYLAVRMAKQFGTSAHAITDIE